MQHRVAFVVGVPLGALGLALSWGLALRDVIAPAIRRCESPSVVMPSVAQPRITHEPIPFVVYQPPKLTEAAVLSDRALRPSRPAFGSRR